MKRILILLAIVIMFSCGTVGKVSERQVNGMFKATKQAKIIKKVTFNMDSHKALLVVPTGDFTLGMCKNIGYFDRVITFEEFELEIIKDQKQEEVGALSGRIGKSNAYRKYKPFLYIAFDNNEENTNYLQLKLIKPDTADELFVTEIFMDTFWSGVYDANTFNPLFNELIRYIMTNSDTY
jgi:hypothetical protein